MREKKLEEMIVQKNKIIEEQRCIIKVLQNEIEADEAIKLGFMPKINQTTIDEIGKIKDDRDYEYLVLSGGGIKGLCYCSALKVLEKEGILYDEYGFNKMKGYCGTSAGSIVASMLAIGMTPKELTNLMMNIDFQKFLDYDIGFARNTYNFVEDYGICPGNYVYNLLGKLIEAKTGNPNYSVENLYHDTKIKLVIVATDMNQLRTIYFHPTNPVEEYRKIPIRKAIRISMGVPFVFEPILCNNNYCVDGGVLDNYAVHAFDGEYPGDPKAKLHLVKPNPKVLGLQIVTDRELIEYTSTERQEINNIFSFTTSFIEAFMTENQRRTLTPANFHRTIFFICPNFPLTNFNLTLKQKEELLKIGSESATKFFT